MKYRGEFQLVYDMLNLCNESIIVSHISRKLQVNNQKISKMVKKAESLGLLRKTEVKRKGFSYYVKPVVKYKTTEWGNQFKEMVSVWCENE